MTSSRLNNGYLRAAIPFELYANDWIVRWKATAKLSAVLT